MQEPMITKEEIVKRLRSAGITRGCDWQGYERAKQILLSSKEMESSEYDRITRMISEILHL